MTSWNLESVLVTAILLMYGTCSAQIAGFSIVVDDIQATTATVSWQPPPGDNTTVTVFLRSGADNTTWNNDNEDSRRILTDLKEYTQYTVCVFNSGPADDEVLPEECETFRTAFTMRTVAAFGCSTFLLLSFCVVTILDLLYGSVKPNEEQQKQNELLEEGAKTFKRKKAKKRKKKDRNAAAVAAVVDDEEIEETKEMRDSIVDQLLRDSGLEQVADSAIRFATPRDSVVEDDGGSLTLADLATSN